MQLRNLNLIVFEESEATIDVRQDIQKKTIDDLFAQLNAINKRILKVQIQEKQIRGKVDSVAGNSKTKTTANIQQIIMMLQKKLQMLIEQSQRAIDEIKDEVERILTKEVLNRKMKKFQSNEQMNKIDRIYQQKLKILEDSHRAQLQEIQRKNSQIQNNFQQKIIKMEDRLVRRIKQLQANENNLKNKIQQLQARCQHYEQSKMLSIQQSKNNIKKENAIDEDNSRIRRNKIFDKRRKKYEDEEVSPIKNVDYSDIASMKILNKDLQKFEDFKQHDLNGSDEDVFFYPQTNRVSHEQLGQFRNIGTEHLPIIIQAPINFTQTNQQHSISSYVPINYKVPTNISIPSNHLLVPSQPPSNTVISSFTTEPKPIAFSPFDIN